MRKPSVQYRALRCAPSRDNRHTRGSVSGMDAHELRARAAAEAAELGPTQRPNPPSRRAGRRRRAARPSCCWTRRRSAAEGR